MNFKVLYNSKKSGARLGVLTTRHGKIQTPCFVPVGTNAAVKTLTAEDLKNTQTQVYIANTFHLHLRPGEKVIKNAGGLHNFSNWSRPIMTDSGGYQVLSFGFGKDYEVGKILKSKNIHRIKLRQQPKFMKITDRGVYFKSPYGGETVYLDAKKSMKIQSDLGADIIFAFDECTPPIADKEYTAKSLDTTNRWAKLSLKYASNKQALFGIVQGGRYIDLRRKSAEYISNLEFFGFGIGGEFGHGKTGMVKVIKTVIKILRPDRPRHLLGIGYLEDIPKIITAGIDLFDCFLPTRLGRHGVAFTSQGKLDLRKSSFLTDSRPLDENCSCSICQNYKRSYICHLIRAHELSSLKMLTVHNLYFFNSYVAKIREKIKKGEL